MRLIALGSLFVTALSGCSPTPEDAVGSGEHADTTANPNAILLRGGAYLMALTDGTTTRDYVIIPDSLDASGAPHNQLDKVSVGSSIVAPPEPDLLYSDNGDALARWAACGYVAYLNGRPEDESFVCFEDAASAVMPIKTKSSTGETIGGQMTWNALGFVRRAVAPPEHVVVPAFHGETHVGLKYVATEHVGVGVAIPETHDHDATMVGDVDFGAPTIDVSGQTLFRDNGVSVTVSSAKVTTRPRLQTALGMQRGNIEHLKVVLDDALDVDLAVTMEGAASYEKDVDKDLFVFSKTLPPQIVGGVPLVETLRFVLHGHCHVSLSSSTTVTAGVALHESVSLGVEYTANGGWTNLSKVAAPTITPRVEGLNASASATLACDLTPKFSLLFYDLVGPYISVTPSATLAVVTSQKPGKSLDWRLDADFRGDLGVEANTSIPFVGQLLSGGQIAHLTLFNYQSPAVAVGSLP
jgi:hypothetical protein